MNYFGWVLIVALSFQLYGAEQANSGSQDDCWRAASAKTSVRFQDFEDWEEIHAPSQTSAVFNDQEKRGGEILRALHPDLFPKTSRGIVLMLSDAVTSSVTGVAENIAYCSLSVAVAHILAGASAGAALEVASATVAASVTALSAPTALTAFGIGTLTVAASNAGREIAGQVSERVSTFVKCVYRQEEWPLIRNAALIALVSPVLGQSNIRFEGADAQEMVMRLHQFRGTFRNYKFEPFTGSQEDKFIQKEDQKDGGAIYRIVLNLDLRVGVKITVNHDQSVVLGHNSLA